MMSFSSASAGNRYISHVVGRVLLVATLLPVGCTDRENSRSEEGAPPSGSLEIGLKEAGMTTSLARIGPGATQFTIVNHGQYPHGIVIRGNGFEQKIPSVAPGMQTVLTVDLEPGTYELTCPMHDAHGDHDQIGERVEFVVK